MHSFYTAAPGPQYGGIPVTRSMAPPTVQLVTTLPHTMPHTMSSVPVTASAFPVAGAGGHIISTEYKNASGQIIPAPGLSDTTGFTQGQPTSIQYDYGPPAVYGGELPKLYVHKISCNCLGPWLLLKEAGIPFELVVVDVTKGDSHTPEFLALNPMGKVPVFVNADGTVVWESNTIMRYIAEYFDIPDSFFPRYASEVCRIFWG